MLIWMNQRPNTMSNKPRQATLFQSWGGKSQSQTAENSGDIKNKHQKQPAASRPREVEDPEDAITLLDSDDEELARALEESLVSNQKKNSGAAETVPSSHLPSGQDTVTDNNECNVSFGIEEQDTEHGIDRSHCLSQWNATDMPVEELQGYDPSAGKLWIYPTNYPVREYQFAIVRQALLKNTLVTLPTGLGKTFIASVVMYNFYRWYPEGKVVFMAPTKPLVAQQIEACYNIMGIPRQDTAEMTGNMVPTERQKAWRDRRVFFLTPQVIMNDLSRGTCVPDAVKCLVVDEAHKALGNHAYCQVVRELVKYTHQFRVLALSATPGSDIKAVQNVISNLLISHIELRSEDSPDIKPYTHERTVEKIVVPLGEELSNIKLKYSQILELVAKRLVHHGVLFNRTAKNLVKYHVLQAREAFRKNPPPSLSIHQTRIVEGDFSLAMTLCHGYDLLQQHGLRSLFNFFEGVINGSKSSPRTRGELRKNANFQEIMELLNKKFQNSGHEKPAFVVGHPKLVKLQEVVLKHFRSFEDAGRPTRAMIFSQFRDSVQEITDLLQQHHPLVKVMSFIGQSSTGKVTKGFTQKEQLKVMQAFRTGGYNTLVSTCVGEEGLDIGEVDLIVCYDAHKSPIRLVQRMGRTGRKRQGCIIMLMTEGKEEQIYNQSQYTKRSIHRAITNGAKSLVFYANNCRMVPIDVTPACHRMHITVRSPPQPQGKQKNHKHKSKMPVDTVKPKAGKKAKREEAGISLEEFTQLKSAGCILTAHALARPKALAFLTEQQRADDEEDGTEMNMAEWLPWQNSLQDTSHFGHSRRSQHLIELLQFTDLQQILPPEEDNYGHEMRLYLDMDDVPSDQRRPVSNDITQFVVPSQKKQASFKGEEAEKWKRQMKKGDLVQKAAGATRKKSKHVIPTIQVSEENSDDSDFLPEVDFSLGSVSRGCEMTVPRTSDSDKGPKESGAASLQQTAQKQEAEDVTEVCEPAYLDAVNNNTSGRTRNSLDGSEVTIRKSDRADRQPFRIPTPPPIEEISTLLSLIKPEDWEAVNVDEIVRNHCFEVPFSLKVPLKSPPHLDVDSIEWNVSNWETEQYGSPPSIICRDCISPVEQERKNESELETETDISQEAFRQMQDNNDDDLYGFRNVQTLQQPDLAQSCVKREITHCSVAADHTSDHQQNQSDTDEMKTAETDDELPVDASVSESFLNRNFFDDDEDFEAYSRKPPIQAEKGKLSPTVHQENCSSKSAWSPNPCLSVASVLPPVESSPKAGTASTSDSSCMITFTQALSFIHNQSASESGLLDSSKISTQHTPKMSATQATAKRKTLDQSKKEDSFAAHDDEELPNFDLGFDFDEDIIPPSPEAEKSTVSQLVVKCVSQPAVESATCNILGETSGKKDTQVVESSAGIDDFDDDDSLFGIVQDDVEPDLKCLSLGFQPAEGTGTSKADVHDLPTTADVHKQCVISEDEVDVVHLPKIQKRKLALSSKMHRQTSAPKKIVPFKGFEEKLTPSQETNCHEETKDFSDGRINNVEQVRLDKSPFLQKNYLSAGVHSMSLTSKQPQLKQPLTGTCLQTEDTHCVGLDLFPKDLGSLSDNEADIELDSKQLFTGVSHEQKSPIPSERGKTRIFCSTPVHSKKTALSSTVSNANRMVSASDSTSARKIPAFSLDLEDDDFEESTIQIGKKRKKAKLSSSDSMEEDLGNVVKKQQKVLAKKRKLKGRKHRFAFLDDEAELSGDDVSSDEAEEDTEMLEGSFIDNCTQLTQSSKIDMQAVYMKSVRSPVHRPGHHQRGRYRMQLEPTSIDVYSQRPSHLEEEESMYQEDSFCVGSDEEESIHGDSEEDETMNMVTTHKRKKRQAVKGRKRVCQLADSSSDEENDFQRMPPSQVYADPVAVKAILSSSDDTQEISTADIITSPVKNGPQNQKSHQGSEFSPAKFEDKAESILKHSCVKSPLDTVHVGTNFLSKAYDTEGEYCKQWEKRRLSASNRNPKADGFELIWPSEESSFWEPVKACSSEVSSSDQPVLAVSTSVPPPVPVTSNNVSKLASESSNPDCVSADLLVQSFTKDRHSHVGDGDVTDVQNDVTGNLSLPSGNQGSSSTLTCTASRESGKMLILVDSREISGAQDILSALRLEHKARVYVRQLTSCDYVVSDRMAVERITWSRFCNGSNRRKIIQRLRHMQTLHDRCVVIVEADRVKPGEEKKKKSQWCRTKYVDTLVTYMSQATTRLFFTNNQGETASLIIQLATTEFRKGKTITVSLDLTPVQEKVLKFYLSLPFLNITHALNLCFNFRTVKEFIFSSVKDVHTKGHMSFSRATDVVAYLHHRFSKALCSSK